MMYCKLTRRLSIDSAVACESRASSGGPSLDFFQNSTAAANCCVAPVLAFGSLAPARLTPSGPSCSRPSRSFPASGTFRFIIFFLMIASNLVAVPSQLPSWNNAGWKPRQQQWSHKQQSWNLQNDQRAMQRKQQKEHQTWERAQKKRQKSSFKLLQPVG